MNSKIRATFALTIAAAIPFALTTPATATTQAEFDFSFDCGSLSGYQTYPVPIIPGESVTVNLVDCDGAYISDVTNGDSTPGTDLVSTADGVVTNNAATYLVQNANEDITFTGAAVILFYGASGNTNSAFIALQTIETNALTNPSGSKIIDSTAVIPTSPSDFSITDGIFDDGGDVLLNGNETCDLEPGSHVYVAKRFHVTTAGEYTFRFLGTNPVGNSLDFNQEWTPLDDPMVALYRGEFDPQNPGANVANCNDDLNDYSDLNGVDWTSTDTPWVSTVDGDIIEDRFSYFVSTLEPGDYTFVFTSYGAYSATEWASGNDWTAQDITIDYDVWGPSAGITEVDHFVLASTGFDAEFGLWAALGLVGTGFGIALARRRAQRA